MRQGGGYNEKPVSRAWLVFMFPAVGGGGQKAEGQNIANPPLAGYSQAYHCSCPGAKRWFQKAVAIVDRQASSFTGCRPIGRLFILLVPAAVAKRRLHC